MLARRHLASLSRVLSRRGSTLGLNRFFSHVMAQRHYSKNLQEIRIKPHNLGEQQLGWQTFLTLGEKHFVWDTAPQGRKCLQQLC